MKTKVVIREVTHEDQVGLYLVGNQCQRPYCNGSPTHVIQTKSWAHYVCRKHAQEFKEKHPKLVVTPAESEVTSDGKAHVETR